MYVDDFNKRCPSCETVKPVTDFHSNQATSRKRSCQRSAYCRPCMNVKSKTYREKLRAEGKLANFYRKHDLKKSYGITIEKYEQMLSDQNGSCAVCKGPSKGHGRYHVDHDHKTGSVRGLLCTKCNFALGMVDDNPDILKGLIAYLQRYS